MIVFLEEVQTTLHSITGATSRSVLLKMAHMYKDLRLRITGAARFIALITNRWRKKHAAIFPSNSLSSPYTQTP